MAMRSPIPKEIRDVLSEDTFMRDCIVAHECEGRIHFDHAFKYAGKRVNELWSILPLCAKHNMGVTSHVEVLRRMNLRARITHFKAEDEFRAKYPKSDLLGRPKNSLITS